MKRKQVTKELLTSAINAKDWIMLDELLYADRSLINNNQMFTDRSRQKWGMLLECVSQGELEGVRILLKHGAHPNMPSWGDTYPFREPLVEAQRMPAIHTVLSEVALMSA